MAKHHQQRIQSDLLPVPVGMNTADPATALGPLDAISLVNLIHSDKGDRPRPGFSEWSTNVGSTVGDVRSILSYGGNIGAKDRLFACAPNGIYDCTAGGAAPTLKHTFATNNVNSGYGNATGFTTAAGRFLAYADETNGYLLYTEATDAWTVGSVTGIGAGTLTSVLQWKNRLWFGESGTSHGWFLGTGAISGAATQFDFGPFFQYGGTLLGLYRWTIDAGQGADDYLVAISTAGDAVVFQGTDPVTNFALRGTWFLGGMPAGKRVAISHGGDLLILTNFGLVNLSALVSGQAVTPQTYETNKIRPYFMDQMTTNATRRGWQLAWHPEDNFLLINMPILPGVPQEQLAMSSARRGWSKLRGLDILSMETWNRQLYFGTRDGRVCRMTGFVDNVQLGGVTTNAKAVECVVLGPFGTYGAARRKMVKMVQMFFVTHGQNPATELVLRYDYDIGEPSGSLNASPPGAGAWDGAVWDSGIWAGGAGTYAPVFGGTGIGMAVSVGAHFFSSDYTVLTGFAVHWEQGAGML